MWHIPPCVSVAFPLYTRRGSGSHGDSRKSGHLYIGDPRLYKLSSCISRRMRRVPPSRRRKPPSRIPCRFRPPVSQPLDAPRPPPRIIKSLELPARTRDPPMRAGISNAARACTTILAIYIHVPRSLRASSLRRWSRCAEALGSSCGFAPRPSLPCSHHL